MGAQLNIKSEDAYRLASRLAELTGQSLTAAVTAALRAELDREERARDKAALRARIDGLTAEIVANMSGPVSSDHSWLYDDATGLPR